MDSPASQRDFGTSPGHSDQPVLAERFHQRDGCWTAHAQRQQSIGEQDGIANGENGDLFELRHCFRGGCCLGFKRFHIYEGNVGRDPCPAAGALAGFYSPAG